MGFTRHLFAAILLLVLGSAQAQTSEKVVDIPTRPGVMQRLLVITPAEPKAAVVLIAGGHGGLQIFPSGSMKWGDGNFLVRSRQLFASQGFIVAVVDAPSDRLLAPYLQGFRQTQEHVADLKAVISWLRLAAKLPVWMIGTSRGTQSAAYAATQLTGTDGPNGLVLTSTILSDTKSRSVLAMPLGKISIPTLVVHHELDGCSHCAYSEIPALMAKLTGTSSSQLLSFTGGENLGDPCEALAYHGFNGLESEVVRQIAVWMLARQ